MGEWSPSGESSCEPGGEGDPFEVGRRDMTLVLAANDSVECGPYLMLTLCGARSVGGFKIG